MSEQLTYWQWKAAYYESRRHIVFRLGQAFMNDYMRKITWPELFYEENPFKAEEIVLKFLDDNCYEFGGRSLNHIGDCYAQIYWSCSWLARC